MTQTEEPWLIKLHDEWISSNGSEDGVVKHDFAIIIKDLLLGHEISTDTTKETWISLSSCIARCIELRIESHVPDSDRYPLMEITKGLEENLSPGLEQDTRVMVAAQCIILAPTLVSDKMKKLLGGHGKPSGCDVLRLWIRKLEDLADNSGLNSELKAAVVEVRDKLVLLHPELSTGRPGEV
ncbi:Protein of unknown function DUF3632 [Trichophyton rubrum]|nr:Protein of unknown function DUF3632 [Trichophyton rubrum]